MSPDRLAYMANQIGRAFAHQGHENAAAATAEHIRKFWEPRMRVAILAQLDTDQGSLLTPIVRDALISLRSGSPAVKTTFAPPKEGDAKEGDVHERASRNRTGAT